MLLSNIPKYGIINNIDVIDSVDSQCDTEDIKEDMQEDITSKLIYDTINNYMGKYTVYKVLQVSYTNYLVSCISYNNCELICKALHNKQICNNIIKVEALNIPTTQPTIILDNIKIIYNESKASNIDCEKALDLVDNTNTNTNIYDNTTDNNNDLENNNNHIEPINTNLLIVDLVKSAYNKMCSIFKFITVR